MLTQVLNLKGKRYKIRRYKGKRLVETPLDRFIYHLAFQYCADVANPQGWTWAALLIKPYERAFLHLDSFFPRLTWDERHAILDTEGAIVFSKPGTVKVLYFDDVGMTKEVWEKLKASSVSIGDSEESEGGGNGVQE